MADQTQHKLHWGPIAVGIAILAVLYLLSVGPAVWLATHGYLPSYLVNISYSPLLWLRENLEWFGEIVGWYLKFWWVDVSREPDLI